MYYDAWLGGQYTFKIIELHKKYGPIIRISPWELHIADPVGWPQRELAVGSHVLTQDRTSTTLSTQGMLLHDGPRKIPISQDLLG